MSTDNPKHALLDQFAAVAKALGHPARLELVEFAAQGECSVDGLARKAGLTVANASQHLLHLRRAGILVSRQVGKRVLYRLADPAVLDLVAALQGVAERNLAEARAVIDDYFGRRDALEPVSRQALLERQAWPATYRTTEPVVLLKLGRQALEEALQGNPDPRALLNALREQRLDAEVIAEVGKILRS